MRKLKMLKKETIKEMVKRIIKEEKRDDKIGYDAWSEYSTEIIKNMDLPTSYKVIDWPDLPKNIKQDIITYLQQNKTKYKRAFMSDDERFSDRWSSK